MNNNERYTTDIYTITKVVSGIFAVLAVVLFLSLSVVIYRFSEERPDLYQYNYEGLSNVGQAVATGMRNTGKVETDIARSVSGSGRMKNTSGYNIFDDISDRHTK